MSENNKDNKHDDHGRDEVEIFMNEPRFQIHRGKQSVANIKQVCHVEETWVIELLHDGKLELLPNDGHVVIKGGEHFISHVAGGGSS